MGAVGVWTANQGTPDDTPKQASPDPADRASLTVHGCEILKVEGLDATMVDPPGCTNAHVIEERCGWTLNEVGYPPTTTGGALRFERVNGTYGFATFSTDGSGTVALTCYAGDGPYDGQEWTAEQWRALIRPA